MPEVSRLKRSGRGWISVFTSRAVSHIRNVLRSIGQQQILAILAIIPSYKCSTRNRYSVIHITCVFGQQFSSPVTRIDVIVYIRCAITILSYRMFSSKLRDKVNKGKISSKSSYMIKSFSSCIIPIRCCCNRHFPCIYTRVFIGRLKNRRWWSSGKQKNDASK